MRRHFPSEWTPTAIVVQMPTGPQTVEAYTAPDLPGLAVHECRLSDTERAPGFLTITHVASGRAIMRSVVPLELDDVIAILSPAGDWTLTADQLNADPTTAESMLRAIDRAYRSIGIPLRVPTREALVTVEG